MRHRLPKPPVSLNGQVGKAATGGTSVGGAVGSAGGCTTGRGVVVRVGAGLGVGLGRDCAGRGVARTPPAAAGAREGAVVDTAVGAIVGVTVGWVVEVAVGALVAVAEGFVVGVTVRSAVLVAVGVAVEAATNVSDTAISAVAVTRCWPWAKLTKLMPSTPINTIVRRAARGARAARFRYGGG